MTRHSRELECKRKQYSHIAKNVQLIEDFMKDPHGIGVLMLCSVVLFFLCVLTLTYGGTGQVKIAGGIVVTVLLIFHFVTRNSCPKSHCF